MVLFFVVFDAEQFKWYYLFDMSNQKSYTAIFEKDSTGAYNVWFPDLPGCFTYGHNLEHAKQMAQEVLELWLEELEAKGVDTNSIQSTTLIEQVSPRHHNYEAANR